MRLLRVVVTIFIIGVIYLTYIFFSRTGEVHGVYQDFSYSKNWRMECRSTIVLVDKTPLTQAGLIKLWYREKDALIEKWKPLSNDCDYILFVRNKMEYPYDSEEMKCWVGDYQICLKGAIGECISRDERLFYIGTNEFVYGGSVAGKIGDKNLHIHFID